MHVWVRRRITWRPQLRLHLLTLPAAIVLTGFLFWAFWSAV
jgi:hypothetical protein